ncbi:MAG: GNAT family N-acetyltransferase [Reyranellaceae bacterium]
MSLDDLPAKTAAADGGLPPPWRPMRAVDLPAVQALGNRIHATLPESAAVFAERCALFPAGAWAAEHRGHLAAYALFHPWRALKPPPLDSLLGAIPAAADILYLHDVVVDPVRRSLGLAGAMIGCLPAIAGALSLPAIELVAVLGTANFWRGHGFVPVEDARLAEALAKYGDGACLMRRTV